MPAKPTPANPNALLISAIDKLTQQLQKSLDFYQDQENKVAKSKRVFREDQDQETPQLSLFEPVPQKRRDKQLQKKGQEQLFGTGDFYREAGDNLPPDSDDRTQPPPQQQDQQQKRRTFGETMGNLQDQYQQATGSRLSKVRSALGSFAPSSQDSMPPGSGGAALGQISSTDALSWAVLGEHGGPAFIRNMALESYGLQRSIQWAQNSAQLLQNRIPEDSMLATKFGLSPENLNAVQGAISLAAEHPLATYAAYKAGTGVISGLGSMAHGLSGWEQMGAGLGVPTTSQRYLFGFRNPLSPFLSGSTEVGAGAKVNQLQLEGRLPGGMGMGSSLSPGQAKDIIGSIVGEGFGGNENKFGGGDIGTIANQFMGPLMQRFPGLTASDISQFLPILRNSGTSLTQLTQTLNDLGTAAQATHETIGQASSSLIALGQSMQGMGTTQGAYGLGEGFRNIFGLDPQFMGQIAQSPLFQGLMMSQYGILPSGLSDVNPGTASNTSLAMLQMLQRATAGLNRNKYQTINGQQVLVQSGTQAQIDQIAQMAGLDPNVVRRMLGDQTYSPQRINLGTALGSATQSTGIWQYLNSMGKTPTTQQNQQLQKYWSATVAPNLAKSGLNQQQIQQLNTTSDWRERVTMLQNDLNTANKNDTWNQVQQKPSNQTVYVKFTGAAAKIFEQAGPTTAKQAANTGQFAYTGVVNSILGDLEHGASWVGKEAGSLVSGLSNDLGHLSSSLNPFG